MYLHFYKNTNNRYPQKPIYHFVNDTNHADRFSSSNYSYNQNQDIVKNESQY
ncbi:hypothetical protein HYD81_02930 [Mycoplasmopsis bovis]|nr:hypothetical protein HYD81_02930 [Mycoplasmopsis bovis]